MAVEARKKGVTGVPFTIINGRWAVSGGQTAETYAQVRRRDLQPVSCADYYPLDLPQARRKRSSAPDSCRS